MANIKVALKELSKNMGKKDRTAIHDYLSRTIRIYFSIFVWVAMHVLWPQCEVCLHSLWLSLMEIGQLRDGNVCLLNPISPG